MKRKNGLAILKSKIKLKWIELYSEAVDAREKRVRLQKEERTEYENLVKKVEKYNEIITIIYHYKIVWNIIIDLLLDALSKHSMIQPKMTRLITMKFTGRRVHDSFANRDLPAMIQMLTKEYESNKIKIFMKEMLQMLNDQPSLHEMKTKVLEV